MRFGAHHLPPARSDRPLSGWTFGFRLVFVAFLLWASARTMADAHLGSSGHSGLALALLAGIEILAALLFLLRRTQLLGLALLIPVFAAATLMALQVGEMPVRYFYYAMTALFIVAVDRHSSAHWPKELERPAVGQ